MLLLAAVLLGFLQASEPVLVSQTLKPADPGKVQQESGVRENKQDAEARAKKKIHELIDALKRSVNGKARVQNHCLTQGQEVQILENTEISGVADCKVTFITTKTTISNDDRKEIDFTLSVDLAELTMPVSVQPQNFAQCKSVSGNVVQVMSRARPGKVVRVVRQMNSQPANGKLAADAPQTSITRTDLSFFFPSAPAAKEAARTLERAIKACGGKEFPDEDDLP